MKKSLLGLAFAFAMTNVTAAPIITDVLMENYFTVDDFDTTAMSTSVSGAGTDSDSQAAVVFGGTRTIDTVGDGTLGTSAQVVAGIFAFSTDAITTGMSTLSYSSAVGVDLEQGKILNFFDFEVLSIDIGGVALELKVTDSSGAMDMVNFSGAIGSLTADFSQFVGVDFTSVTDISLKVTATNAAADLTLDSFNVSGTQRTITQMPMPVPVPASLPLLGLGLVAFGFGRRKVK